jgi:hypothetical protein
MRMMGALLIAMLVIMGIAAATVDQVKITSPHDGDQFTLGNTIKIRSQVSASNDGQMFVRMLINGARVLTSNWKPTEAGVYTILVEAADNREFTNPIPATVTITVNPSPDNT